MEQNKQNNTKAKRTKIIRHFSEDFRKSIVKELDSNKLKITDVIRLYEVSNVTVYKWLWKYSHKYQKGVRMVLELESESQRTDYLLKRLADAEQSVGKKQMEIEFLYKVIDICSDELGYDVKKKYFTKQLNITV